MSFICFQSCHHHLSQKLFNLLPELLHQLPNQPMSINSPPFLNHANANELISHDDCFNGISLCQIPFPDFQKVLAILIIRFFFILQHTFSILVSLFFLLPYAKLCSFQLVFQVSSLSSHQNTLSSHLHLSEFY